MLKLPAKVRIEGVVPEDQLPEAPYGFLWQKRRLPTKTYKYKTVYQRVRKYYYVWVQTFTPTKHYFYEKVRGKRRRIYLKKQRIYYSVRIPVKEREYKRVYRDWWILAPLIVKKVRWLPTEVVLTDLREKYDGLEEEQTPFFNYIEMYSRYNYDRMKFPKSIYDLVFLYYVIEVPVISPKKASGMKFILVSSSFDLGRWLTIPQVIKEIPKFILLIKRRMARKKRANVSFMELVAWTGVKKRQLEEGKRNNG